MAQPTASGEWLRLDGLRRGFITRCEKYAGFTLSRLCTETGFDQMTTELSHDWQSVGAQATNHVVNKLVLTLFNPGSPFFRLEADAKWKAQILANGVKEAEIDTALAAAEQAAIKEMDRRPVRPKLYQALANLVVLGNVCMYLPRGKDKTNEPRVFGIKQFVVRRTGEGKLKCLIIRECLMFDELESEVQAYCLSSPHGTRHTAESKVELFKYLERQVDGSYKLSQWVGDKRLPDEYDGAWSEADCPYRVLTWNLQDESDYGTGLVEDFSGDFAALSALSEAQVKGAILASEFRWLVNPGGMTKPEDLEQSENGAAIPGVEGDISLIANSKPGDLAVVQNIASDYIRRIGQGFLLGSATTRDAERVTAVEIRMQAMELETSFGGTYSRIAVDLQGPFADWLLLSVDFDLKGTKIKRSIITGLDALSRNGDLENLRLFVQDIAQVTTLPEQSQNVLELGNIFAALALGRNLDPTKYVKSEAKQAQEQEARQAAQQEAMAQEQGAKAASAQIVQGTKAQ